jgi:predicted negative regulator of RcsB-dependent stress response
MARAIAREKRKEAVSTEDQIAVRLLQLASWASQNSRAVIVGAVVVVGIAAGIWYFISYQQSVMEQAAVELESLRTTAAIGSQEEAVVSLNTFIDRFGGTVYADEARLMVGRLQLNEGEWAAAISVLSPATEESLDTPVGFGAGMLLAFAYEGAGEPGRAVELLGTVAAGARYGYQRHQALEEQARILVSTGEYDRAVAVYETLLEDTAGTANDRIRSQLAEARALSAAVAAGLTPAPRGLPPAEPGAGGEGTTVPTETQPPDAGSAAGAEGGNAPPQQ